MKMAALTPDEEIEKQVAMFKIKKMVKVLSNAKGNGTSMISLVIPPKDQICRVSKMLSDEYGTASNIKSRVNRLSVLGAITSTQQRLKLYTKVPPNGLVLYCGMVVGEDGKERKMNIDFEPFKPINTSLYLCDNKFHTEALNELLDDDDKFGFIVMDGNGCLYGTLQGSNREVLHKFSVDLPKKHGRGGQSALRFARLRLEKRHNYVRKVAETAVQMFITDNKPNIRGLVLCGSAEFKNDLASSDLFDGRLLKSVIKTVDVSYGGESGFNQAIELSAETLGSVKLVQEKRLIQKWFDEIATDTGKYCFMIKDTLNALELGAVETLIVWDQLDADILVLKNNATGAETTLYLTSEQQKNSKYFRDEETGGELETISKENLTDHFAENYRKWGCSLEFVTNRSQEGSQFCRGFGGIGGLLRWKVDFAEMEMAEELDEMYM
jgi:peptide chain release factor subunit 1